MKINELLSEIKTYTGFSGWVVHFFGRCVKVQGKKGQNLYFHKDQLISALFKAARYDGTSNERKAVTETALEMLNPVLGKPLTIDKVKKKFALFAGACSRRKPSFERVQKKLEELKTRKLAQFNLSDASFVERLQPGDLLFKKNPSTTSNLVVRAQKITKLFTLSQQRDREGFKYSHVAIYLGNNEIAEAVTDKSGSAQIRKISIFDPRFIKPGGDETFVVTRSRDKVTAQDAADVARSIAATPTADDSSHPHKYSFLNALRSLWHTVSFGPFAKVRYLKQYIDDRNQQNPTGFMNPRNFYCSQLVGYCYQTAESRNVARDILGHDNKPKVSSIPFASAISRAVWARVNRWKHYAALDQKVKMQFDSKWMNPQDFRHFVVAHKELFKDRIYLWR